MNGYSYQQILLQNLSCTAQKMKFCIKNFSSKCELETAVWSHLLEKSLIENFIFCAVLVFPLTQENVFSVRFHSKVNRKTIGSSKKRC